MDNTKVKENIKKNAPNGDVWISLDSQGRGAVNLSHASEIWVKEDCVFIRTLEREKPMRRTFETKEKAQAFYNWICGLIHLNKFEG